MRTFTCQSTFLYGMQILEDLHLQSRPEIVDTQSVAEQQDDE